MTEDGNKGGSEHRWGAERWQGSRRSKKDKHTNIWPSVAGDSKSSFVHIQRQRADITDNFAASPCVVMATTHIGSPACPWLPEHTLETTIMR